VAIRYSAVLSPVLLMTTELSLELDGLLEGVAVSVLLDDELDTDSVELGVGVPGSLELGVWLLLLRLEVPLPGGCWVVAQTGI
jgi:hypothetical protein